MHKKKLFFEIERSMLCALQCTCMRGFSSGAGMTAEVESTADTVDEEETLGVETGVGAAGVDEAAEVKAVVVGEDTGEIPLMSTLAPGANGEAALAV
jgi:hypothetical protein